MSSHYKLVISDIRGQSPQHFPYTLRRKFFSFQRAWECLKIHHSQNRDVVLIERNSDGILETWEVKAEHGIANYTKVQRA
jgi:hypothetical protein